MTKNNKGEGTAAMFGIIFVMVVLVGVAILALGYDTVEPSHMGVMVKFGNILGPMSPGMKWTGLFTHVEQYDMRVRKDTIVMDGSNAAATKQGQAVYATINVNYRIKDDADVVTKLYSQVGTDDQIDDKLNIKAIITEGFKQTTVKYDWIGILENREQVKEEAITAIKNNFPKDYFDIQDVVVTNIGFSPDFQNELEAKQIAQQTALKEQNNLDVVKFQQQQEIEKYKAEAEKLKLQKSEITGLLNQQAWIARWNGQLPSYMIVNNDMANTLLQLPSANTGVSAMTDTNAANVSG